MGFKWMDGGVGGLSGGRMGGLADGWMDKWAGLRTDGQIDRHRQIENKREREIEICQEC